jgi:hypothetical protein
LVVSTAAVGGSSFDSCRAGSGRDQLARGFGQRAVAASIDVVPRVGAEVLGHGALDRREPLAFRRRRERQLADVVGSQMTPSNRLATVSNPLATATFASSIASRTVSPGGTRGSPSIARRAHVIAAWRSPASACARVATVHVHGS